MRKSLLKRGIATAKEVVTGDEEDEGRAEGNIVDARASSKPTSPFISLLHQCYYTGSRKTFRQFTPERGLGDDANNDVSTGEDDLS